MGDIACFMELLKHKQDMLYRIAYTYTHNQADAEDCLSTATIKAFDKISQLKKDESFYTWFNSILINTCRAYHQKHKGIVPYHDELNNLQSVYSISSLEDKILIEEILSTLHKRESEILQLRYIKNYSLKEIAHILTIPENTVKTLIYRTLKKLRKKYGRVENEQ